MAPKKRTRNDAGASSSQPAFDENLFVSERAFERYKLLSVKNSFKTVEWNVSKIIDMSRSMRKSRDRLLQGGGRNLLMSLRRRTSLL